MEDGGRGLLRRGERRLARGRGRADRAPASGVPPRPRRADGAVTRAAGARRLATRRAGEDLLPGEIARPEPGPARGRRVAEIVAAARHILESEGRDALTMRRLADELGIQAPSLYKHFSGKAAVEMALIEDAMFDIGDVTHRALHE